VFKKVLLPANAPQAYEDREVLWNAVEMGEKGNGQLARTIDLDLPKELSRDEQINLLLSYVQKNFVDVGMCADIAVHDKGNGNPHAHLILTLRGIDKDGKWQRKWKKRYILDDRGNKIYDPITKRYQCGPSIPLNDWGNRENAELWRREWADMCNHEFERKGLQVRVTHESYIRQGVNREPQLHLGRKVMALEQRGIYTDRSNANREIIQKNRLRDERKRERSRSRADGRSR
jgi:ATP-dependent exoDNAse (exonuclease V) alpha subunit